MTRETNIPLASRVVTVLIAVVAISQAAQAMSITLDTADYDSVPAVPDDGNNVLTPAGTGRALGGQGNLSGGSNGTWTGGATFAVVAGAGTSSSAGIVMSSSASAYFTSIYSPTASEMDNIPYNPSSSQVDFAFEAKLVAASTTNNLLRIWFGYENSSTHAIELRIQGDGDFYDDLGRLAEGTFADNQYHSISGRIDYGTQTYTLFLDGSQIGSGPRAFDGTQPSSYGGVALNTMTSGANGSVAVDDIVFTVVPEPATLGLMGLGAVALLRRRRTVR